MSLLAREMTASRCVGGKAAVLAELRDAGFAVPAFEVSPSDLFGAMQRVGAPVAVRSCATLEDGDAASFAGQFHTALNVGTAGELEQAVAACRASVDAEEVQRYCGRHGIDASRLRMDVIVQKMVSAQLSGV
ncbi:MAG: PEP/pyruvate-binding domain-containing protein, partial [Phycisphaeraceae bacterium]